VCMQWEAAVDAAVLNLILSTAAASWLLPPPSLPGCCPPSEVKVSSYEFGRWQVP